MDEQQYQQLTQLLQQVLGEKAQVKIIVAQEEAFRLRGLLLANQHLRQQLESTQQLLAAKEEILTLLRARHTQSN